MFPVGGAGTSFRTDYTMTKQIKNKTEGRDRREGHILVIDDERPICGLAERILTAKGYNVTTCASGAEAVEIYSKLHDDVDLVILDMVMPEMNGVETLRHLKQIDPTVRVVLCSAFIPDLDGHTTAAEEFVGFIAKPFKVGDFLAIADLHMK